MKEKTMMWIGIISLLISICILMFCYSSTNPETNDLDIIDYDNFKEIEDDIISDSQYNFQVMRDLFTTQYNDSATVENAEYDNGFCFWVNHSRVLNSYYFENMNNYLVRFPRTTGRIEVLN